ncbi:hypothetical protein BHM03_00000786 [Ensete ventricosum]|nr:hypothetical protein BHM03_00000786 [Ensete ventricosum]
MDVLAIWALLLAAKMPVCTSSPAVFPVRSWSSVGWVEPRGSAREVDCRNGGARVELKHSSSGRPLTPARRSGRVGSRRDPSDGQVSSVVGFVIPLPRRGAGAFIVSDVGYSYLVTLLSLWPTMSSYPSTTLVVLAVRRASAGRGCRPYLCQVSCTSTDAPHTGIRPAVRGHDDVAARSTSVISELKYVVSSNSII